MTIELIKENEIQETCDMVARACKNSVFAEFYPRQPKYFSIPYDEIKQKAEYGCIGAYWDSLTESWIKTIFVEPSYQHKGIGRKIIVHLENDEYAKRAKRIEIHSAISAIPFYRKLGYEHKNGDLSYKDGMFDLEKFI